MNRLALALVLAACSKSDGKPLPRSAPVAEQKPVTTPPPGDAKRPPVDAKSAPVLPPFGSTATSDPAKANALASKALRVDDGLGDADDHALEDAIAAVSADPGSAVARYAVACVSHDEAFGKAQLQLLLDAKGCESCVDELSNVVSDTSCPWTPAEKALAGKVRPSPQRAALDAILAALASHDRSAARRYFTGARVTSHFACSNCDDARNDKRAAGNGPKVFAQIVEVLAGYDFEESPGQYQVQFLTGNRILRAGDCFSVEWARLAHNTVYFDQLCFAHGTTNVVSIDFTEG